MKRVLLLAALVLAASGLIATLDYYQGDIIARLERGKPQVKTDPLPLGNEIQLARVEAQNRQVAREYGRIRVLLDQARAQGLPVDKLEPLLLTALNMARAKRYEQALTLLNRVEFSIPRKPEPVVVASPTDAPPEEPEIKTRSTEKKAKAHGKAKPKKKAKRRATTDEEPS